MSTETEPRNLIIQTQIDWPSIADAARKAGEAGVYIGTIFTLTPSGKYYLPFANGNVEVCRTCATNEAPCEEYLPCVGDGCCEVCRDAQWWVCVEKESERHNLSVLQGEDDPCDVFAYYVGD